ncbi:sensor histidine kinase [Cohnella cholangitidis]|uniref:Heme sensor protein HssS n=1 Tax=Cohnella cholangitidis TaxID=2598458 RepID=A0A7G5C0Z1_9BACL|nr:HAMP domain-containing sensor histidine kinase [Cohnella cholangitidis]QMV42875.1 HAMP domain-containing protein [Cohnella cholangitidis]
MKTLYVRIVLTFMVVALLSGVVGVVLTSLYYQEKIKTNNEDKILAMGQSIGALYGQDSEVNLDTYLTGIAALGFQIYAVDESMNGKMFGGPFKHGKLSDEEVQTVLDGGIYHGMKEENNRLEIFSLFENSVRNTVGIPLSTTNGPNALFIRPDLEKQIGEIRIIVAVLLGFTFVTSLILIVILTRFIVKPLQVLKKATQQIGKGNFNVGLEKSRNRKDEFGDLADHFARMAESIQRLDRMRQEFVANVSHEFQSPLTSIQGFARAVLDKQVTAEQSERYWTIVEQESKRLSSLSKQLLKLAALDKEDQRLQMTTFRLDEQIREIIIMLEWQWTEKRLNLELELPEATIAADAPLLYEVWLNLISNAIYFTPSGGTIGVEITDCGAVGMEIEFRDSGVGIPASEIPYIFERFHKADKARNRTSSGSGLGLSIVHKIISLHGGTIEVQSEVGKGTLFTVRIPRL